MLPRTTAERGTWPSRSPKGAIPVTALGAGVVTVMPAVTESPAEPHARGCRRDADAALVWPGSSQPHPEHRTAPGLPAAGPGPFRPPELGWRRGTPEGSRAGQPQI